MSQYIDPRPLGSAPRKIKVISTTDGGTREFLDDGGALTTDGFFPNAHRQALERHLAKRHRGPAARRPALPEPIPVFILLERPPAIHDNDPLLTHPCLDEDPSLQKLIDAGVEARTQHLEAGRAEIEQAHRSELQEIRDRAAGERVARVASPASATKRPKASAS